VGGSEKIHYLWRVNFH